MSDPFISDIDFVTKMAWVWTSLKISIEGGALSLKVLGTIQFCRISNLTPKFRYLIIPLLKKNILIQVWGVR